MLALLVFFAWLGLASAEMTLLETKEVLSQADQQDLRKIATGLKQAILKEDIEGILRHVDRQYGLTCTDTGIPYRQVRKDLYNKSSHLHLSLFDTARFAERCSNEYPSEYPAISDKEFFSKATNETIEISPIEKDWAKVTFRSSVKGHFPREWFFHKAGWEWKLTNGFIISRCSCG